MQRFYSRPQDVSKLDLGDSVLADLDFPSERSLGPESPPEEIAGGRAGYHGTCRLNLLDVIAISRSLS